ncbi:MAG: SRPBCC domain-containing protein [Desulfovibrio sp.]|nr:SRPBCC domain-containing protein [Desulfovibrio sp.]
MLASIDWPHEYLPGTTDNFCSNEVIVKDLPVRAVWDALIHPLLWPGYYANSSDIEFPAGETGNVLHMGCVFRFKTFGFPIDAEVIQFEEPGDGRVGRLSWHGWAEGDKDHRLDVVHAWLIESLPENRTRILTQESQIGKAAKELAKQLPNPMINGHQAWLDGIVQFVRKQA